MPLMKSSSKKVISYLAGVMDSDGCFNIGRCRTTYVPRLLVTNTNKDLVYWLKENFGGDVGKTTVKGKSNWKPRYQWRLSGQRALELADKLYSYLIVKHKQALIFRTMWAVRDVFRQNNRKEGYQCLAGHLGALNKKGVQYAITQRL